MAFNSPNMSEQSQFSRAQAGRISSIMLIRTLFNPNVKEDTADTAIPPNGDHVADSNLGVCAAFSETENTCQLGSFPEWHGGSVQDLGGMPWPLATPPSAEVTARGPSSDHLAPPTEGEEMADFSATEHTNLFFPDPADSGESSGKAAKSAENASVPQYFCETCQTTLRQDYTRKHNASERHQRHQRQLENRLTEEADKSAETSLPRHFCDLCQTTIRQDYVRQHEGTQKHLR
jgi:hypothetical protein